MKDSLINIEIRNRQALDLLVSNLSDMDKEASIKSGLSKGGEVIKQGGINRLRNRMRAGPNGKKGNLMRSFMVRVKRRKPGVLVGFRQGKNGGNHAHLVDLGTIERIQKSKNRKKRYKGGRSGAATPNYFWEDTNNQDMQRATQEVYTGIVAFVEKLKGKL